MNKLEKEAQKHFKSLSDTDLLFGQSNLLVEILNKLPLSIKMSLLKDEVMMAEMASREIKRRLTKPLRKESVK